MRGAASPAFHLTIRPDVQAVRFDTRGHFSAILGAFMGIPAGHAETIRNNWQQFTGRVQLLATGDRSGVLRLIAFFRPNWSAKPAGIRSQIRGCNRQDSSGFTLGPRADRPFSPPFL